MRRLRLRLLFQPQCSHCRGHPERTTGTVGLPQGKGTGQRHARPARRILRLFREQRGGSGTEVKEETGLEVTRTEFLFSLPNTYLYSGFLVHTVDCFFRCTVADSSLAHAMDDAAELLWIPVKELRPEDFGLASVRKGIEKLLAQWP